DALQVQIERRHHGNAILAVAVCARAIGGAPRRSARAARLVAGKTVFARALGADLPEALVLARAGLEKARIERADRRHVGRIEPHGTARAFVSMALTPHTA